MCIRLARVHFSMMIVPSFQCITKRETNKNDEENEKRACSARNWENEKKAQKRNWASQPRNNVISGQRGMEWREVKELFLQLQYFL